LPEAEILLLSAITIADASKPFYKAQISTVLLSFSGALKSPLGIFLSSKCLFSLHYLSMAVTWLLPPQDTPV
jgi:hypothetical protein